MRLTGLLVQAGPQSGPARISLPCEDLWTLSHCVLVPDIPADRERDERLAIVIEGFTVVARKERIADFLESGAVVPPNGTALADEDLWRCSFMAEADASSFLGTLEALDLNVSQGPDPDAVVVDEFDHSVAPYCEWLSIGTWDKAVIAWKTGTQPTSVFAKEGWDPAVGSGLQRRRTEDMENLEFLRLEDGIEVYRDRESDQEVYITRTKPSPEALFQTAAQVIKEHFISPGDNPVEGDARETVETAVAQLAELLTESPDWWNAFWFHGKGHLALGNDEAAYKSFQRAFELEKDVEAIPRELAGVCLNLRKFDEAAEVAERAVVLTPDNPQSLGNLAISYLMAGRSNEASTTIEAALRHDPECSVNRHIQNLIEEIREGTRPQPDTLEDLSKPLPKRKKPFWKLW